MENLIHIFQSGGLVMYPLLLLSLVTLAIAVERFYYYRVNRRDAQTFFHGIHEAVSGRDWAAAKELCAAYETAPSRIIESGLTHDASEASMKTAFEERMTMESIGFHRYLDYLSAIVTIAPLLGLLGTVTGMIQTFNVLDDGGGAAAITGGIGEALVATATGLCVAIIAFCVYTYFSHQVDTIVTDMEALCQSVVGARREGWESV